MELTDKRAKLVTPEKDKSQVIFKELCNFLDKQSLCRKFPNWSGHGLFHRSQPRHRADPQFQLDLLLHRDASHRWAGVGRPQFI